ncbi:unnamed protein product [Rotaria socialis]|uniref:COX assembly mitochondrial protein n=1 Tax=Rotaria socialis TaxID=392032 RepID=A0A820FRY4_9BILA|nr:unnamed protein product [Rotaria socialis]CAF3323101.1 unnamed protein product [Rotaria socialis]CAF3383299.1 unnamed protein product [Rotaria socialis]CAF3433788.1 unnamed protein product [Rotaria socialis]CAF3641842.1 unnamed protein product [Rotaria socialis]
MSDNNTKHKEVFSPDHVSAGRYRGGPHGLGDPDDKTLRKVELEVSIPGIVRDRAHREKCHYFIDEFGKCGEQHGFWAVAKCRKEVKAMNECLAKWFNNEKFREECTQVYLDERTQYRETGVHTKQIKRPYYINPQKELERIKKIRKEYERLEHKDD